MFGMVIVWFDSVLCEVWVGDLIVILCGVVYGMLIISMDFKVMVIKLLL